MRYRASDTGCTAVLADVATVQFSWAAAPSEASGQGSSVARLRATDRQAAEDLFNACYPRLAGWVRRLVDDDETAHEIASEAFTRLLARWSGLDNPQSYLYMIATNLVRDHWRKTGRERRAIRTMTAAAPGEAACHPAQDVDVRALIEGRFNVSFDDIETVAPPALRHRLILNFEAEAEGVTTDHIITQVLQDVPRDARLVNA